MSDQFINVTLSTASVFPRRCAYGFELAAQLGFDGIEVMVWSDSVTQNATKLIELSDKHQIPITSIHAPSLVVSQNVWGVRPATKLEKSVELAEQVGADTVVVHPPFAWQPRYALQFAEHVRMLSRATGITIAVENMYPWRRKKRDYLAYLPHWDPTDQDYDALTLDLSHASTACQSSLELAQTFGSRLRHIHLADGTGSTKDEHLVPGVGTQPCREVIEFLVASGWSGDLAVEIGTRKVGSAEHRVALIRESLEFARAAISGAPVPQLEIARAQLKHYQPSDAWD